MGSNTVSSTRVGCDVVVGTDHMGCWGKFVELALLNGDVLELVLWPGLEESPGRWVNLGYGVTARVEEDSAWVVAVRFPQGARCLAQEQIAWPIPTGWENAGLIGDRVLSLAEIILPEVRERLGIEKSVETASDNEVASTGQTRDPGLASGLTSRGRKI